MLCFMDHPICMYPTCDLARQFMHAIMSADFYEAQRLCDESLLILFWAGRVVLCTI